MKVLTSGGILLVLTLTLAIVACDTQPKQSLQNSSATKDEQQAKTVMQTLESQPQFTTLVTALKASGLNKEFDRWEKFTIFAPTNRAFTALPDGTIEKLLKPKNAHQLRVLLRYHIAIGEYTFKDIKKSQELPTLEGQMLKVEQDDCHWYVGDGIVMQTNLTARDGIIHRVDRVLIPKAYDQNSLK